jgi:hypothetical protein
MSHDVTEQTTDNTPYFRMLRRMVAAAGKRVARADVEDLVELIAIRKDLDEAILRAVSGLRSAGYTWESIGQATGTTRQAAIQKWSAAVAGLDHVSH